MDRTHPRKRLFWRLFVPSYVLVAGASLAIALVAQQQIRALAFQTAWDEVSRAANAIERAIERDRLGAGVPTPERNRDHHGRPPAGLEAWAERMQVSFLLADPDGRPVVVATPQGGGRSAASTETRTQMSEVLDRLMPPATAAMDADARVVAAGTSRSDAHEGAGAGAGDGVWIARRLPAGRRLLVGRTGHEVSAATDEMRRAVWLALAVVLVAAAALGMLAPWRVVRVLREMRRAAERMAAGDLNARLPVPAFRDSGGLALAINRMAEELAVRIQALASQQGEQEALMSSMAEGVIAVDPREHIISANAAAGRVLGIDRDRAVGRSLFEVIRHAGLQSFMVRALRSEQAQLDVIALHGNNTTRYLECVSTRLHAPDDTTMGALVVLHDITRLRGLEAAQRAFVANVSHELRTPATVIGGWAETLRDDAGATPENVARICGIIVGQTERLERLIEDLLSLSRLEQSTESDTLDLKRQLVYPALEAGVEEGRRGRDTHPINVDATAVGAEALLNERLVVQAVANLVDNAINYSREGSAVLVQLDTDAHDAVIRVSDKGMGVSQENISRVFDRFYRVERSRNPKLKIPGTGLGLSIVRTIVIAHGGRVEAASELGLGSTFTIRLPLAPGSGAPREA